MRGEAAGAARRRHELAAREARVAAVAAARVPRTTQSTSARVSARVVSACGFGLAGSVQPAGAGGGVDAKPPRPPPCVVPG